MIRMLARPALLVGAALVATLLAIRLRGYDDSTVVDFFDSCTPMPCWQGIRPGETTLDEAMAILEAHPWVDSVNEVYTTPYSGATLTALIYWTWSAGYPFPGGFPSLQQGLIVTDQGIVRQIYLTTGIHFGDLWLALGGPDGGAMDYVVNTRSIHINNTALFSRDGIAATASISADCSVVYPNYWQSGVYMWLQDGRTLGTENVAYPVYLRVMRTGYHTVRTSLC